MCLSDLMRDMILGLGGVVEHEIAPFDPLNGAYHGLGGTHGHSHGNDHFDQDDDPKHKHAHATGIPHDHG